MEWCGIDMAIGVSPSSSYTALATVNGDGMLMFMRTFKPDAEALDDRFRQIFTWLTDDVFDRALKHTEVERICIAQPIVRPQKSKDKNTGREFTYTNRSQLDLCQARGAVSMVVGAYAPVFEPVESKVNNDIIGRGNPSTQEIIAWASEACMGDIILAERVSASSVNEREDRANAFKCARFALLEYRYEKGGAPF